MTHIKSATCRFRNSLFSVGALVVGLSLANVPSTAFAELSVTGSGALFYTDNANLFSATRRSSLDGDPSQPVLDTSSFGHAKDMVFEPAVRVMKFIPSSWGQTAFTAKVRGFIYSVNPESIGHRMRGSHQILERFGSTSVCQNTLKSNCMAVPASDGLTSLLLIAIPSFGPSVHIWSGT
jgi:hypothetical protein